jgi:hypothetical protein
METKSQQWVRDVKHTRRYPSDTKSITARRYAAKLSIANDEWQRREEEFTALEESLEILFAGTVARYRRLYTTSAGEQFRPDPNRVKCEKSAILSLFHSEENVDPTRKSTIQHLVENEDGQATFSSQARQNAPLVRLAIQGIELEVER